MSNVHILVQNQSLVWQCTCLFFSLSFSVFLAFFLCLCLHLVCNATSFQETVKRPFRKVNRELDDWDQL